MSRSLNAYQLLLWALLAGWLCVTGMARVLDQYGRTANATNFRPAQNWTGGTQSARYNQTWNRPQPARAYQPAVQPGWNGASKWNSHGNSTGLNPVGGNSNIGWGNNGWHQPQQLPGGVRPYNQSVPAPWNSAAKPASWQQPGIPPQNRPINSNPYANLFN